MRRILLSGQCDYLKDFDSPQVKFEVLMRLATLLIQRRNLTSTTFEFRILKNRGYLRNSYRWCCEIPVILKRELHYTTFITELKYKL